MIKEFLLHKDKKKKADRTFKHIWLLPTQKAQTKNQKSLNFANAQ